MLSHFDYADITTLSQQELLSPDQGTLLKKKRTKCFSYPR